MLRVAVLVACVVLSGCVEAEVVRARAADAMKCPSEKVGVDKKDTPSSGPHSTDDVYVASGCGQELKFYCGESLEQTTTRDNTTGSNLRRERYCRPDTE